MRKRERWQEWSNRSPSSTPELSPRRNLPTEDFEVISSSGEWLQDWAPFHSFRWETPAVPSMCEQLDWGKHSSQTNNLSQLFKSDFNSVSIKGEEQLVPPSASTPAWNDMEAATSMNPLGWSRVLAGEFEEHFGRPVPVTKVTGDLTGRHCQKSLGHWMKSGVSKSVRCWNPQGFRRAPHRSTDKEEKSCCISLLKSDVNR